MEVIGALRPTPTMVTDYAIHPFVGLDRARPRRGPRRRPRWPRCSTSRSATCGAGYGLRRILRRAVPFRVDTYLVGEHLIWGATARIVADLLERVGPWLDREP